MNVIDQRESELYELKDRLVKAERKLEDLGYRHCDIAACNCNGYHRWDDPPEVARLKWDIDAYRAALGYPVPGNHTGKLTDGTTPQCGMCNSAYRNNLEDSAQLLHDIASHDGWLRTDSTRELWERLQAWKRDHP